MALPVRRARGAVLVTALTAVLVACSGGTPAASLGPTSPHLQLTAREIAFDRLELSVPSGTAFAIEFAQQDAEIDHDVDIRRADGNTVFDGTAVNGPAVKQYAVGPLEPGIYTYICSIHPIPQMSGTLTVR